MAKSQPHKTSKKKYPKRPRRFNPYKLFYGAMVPNWLLERTEISPGAKLLYARLCQYAGDDGVCFPGQDQLSQALGVSERHVRRYLAELLRFKLIEKERVGLRKTNRYYFLKHRWQKADIQPPERHEPPPKKPNRTHPSALDRTHPSALDRTHPSALDRTFLVSEGASKPRATKPSGRVRDSVVRDSSKENQTTTTPTPLAEIMAPRSTNVVEVVADDFASAPGEEAKTTATDGSIGSDVPLWQQFYDEWTGTHRYPERTERQWREQGCTAETLATIRAKLPWQRKRTGRQQLPDFPHIYLKDRRWQDEPDAGPSARPDVRAWDPDAPRCKVADCVDIPQGLSEKRCDAHARQYIRAMAQELWDIAYRERPANAKERLHRVLSQCHPTDADRFMAAINWEWNQTVDSLAEIIEDVQWQVMADARAAQKLPDAAENILAVVRAERQYGGLDLEKMIKDILEQSHALHLMASLPWQAWQRCAESEIPTVAALVDLMRAAMFWEPGRVYQTGDLLPNGEIYSNVH